MRPPETAQTIRLRDGEVIDVGSGDFTVPKPDHGSMWIRLRTSWPLFPFGSASGQAPAAYILQLLETRSPSHAYNMSGGLSRFCHFLTQQEGFVDGAFSWAGIDEALLLRYLTHLRRQRLGYEFARLRHFYCWAVDAAYPGFRLTLADRLKGLRIQGNPKGVAVLTGDPQQGPLPEPAFRQALRRLATDDGPLLPRVCAALAIELGANPAQYCQLRLRDYLRFPTDAATLYQLDLPRSKKRDGQRDRKRRPLSPQLGALLDTYIVATAAAREALARDDPLLLLTTAGRPVTSRAFNAALRRFFLATGVTVPGSISARRLRRTFATRLVALGASMEQLMELLDHTDAQNAGVYFAMRGDAVARLDTAVGATLAAVVGRFQGTVVATEAAATFGDRPEQRVKAALPAGDVGIGTCGRDLRTIGLCPLFPPASCYTCPLFQPWRDADHAGVAQRLEAQRATLVALDGGDQRNPVVAQLDALLGAVQEVVQTCATAPLPLLQRRRVGKETGGQDA